MADQVDPAASDVSEQTEPESQASEQPKTESKSFGQELLKLAESDGHTIGETLPPKAEDEPDPEPEPEVKPEPEVEKEPATDPEAEPVEAKEEEKPEDKKGDVWPESAKARVAEEAAKRRRANERAERAEALAEQLQAQLQQTVAQPTEDDPFKDVNDFAALDRLERSYEKAVDLADENPDGAVDVVVGKDSDGKELKRDFTPEELVVMRKKADKAIRKFIPERRSYLQQRAIADAEALKIYPEFKDPNSEFTQAAAVLAQRLINGQASKDPTLLIWVGHAIRGYQESLKQQNGNGAVKSPEAKKIVASARQQVAPTPTKTRSFIERGSGSKNLEKAKERLKEEGTPEAAEELVAAVLSGGGSSKRLEPIAE